MKQLERFERLVGSNIEKIKNKTVLVLGLGGVGSYAVESLVRSGIGKLILVDFDIIDITNLNRQLMTNLNNVGMLKTEVWEERIKTISKECEIQSGHVSKLLKELKKQNIIECINEDAKKGRLYRLTDEGIKIADYMDN